MRLQRSWVSGAAVRRNVPTLALALAVPERYGPHNRNVPAYERVPMLIQRHESTTRDPAVRGREIGERFASQVADTLEGYWRLFRAKGVDPTRAEDTAKRALDDIAAWSPSLAAELAGLATGAGLDGWQVALLNARTEIVALAPPSGHGECSTGVHVPVDGTAPRTIQTWDWYLHLATEALVWSYITDAGLGVHGFTEFGILGKIGVNDAGVGTHLNILNHASDGGGSGIPIHLVARRIHDEATSLDEAIEIIRSASLSSSSTISIAAWDGARADAAIVELSPAGVAVLPVAPGRTLLHTNHFLDPELARGEANPHMSDTLGRFAALESRAGAIAETDPAVRADALVAGLPDGGPVCVYEVDETIPDLGWETKATLSLDVAGHRLRYASGSPAVARERGWEEI
jgi:isopenicillin-N N-acyltransferase-like protein